MSIGLYTIDAAKRAKVPCNVIVGGGRVMSAGDRVWENYTGGTRVWERLQVPRNKNLVIEFRYSMMLSAGLALLFPSKVK